MTDEEWLSLHQRSSKKAYQALVEQYGNLVYAIVLSKLKMVASREDIEDCVSDVFVAVFQSADQFSTASGSLKAYLTTIAKHTAIDAYRRLTYRQGCTTSMEEETVVLPSLPENVEQKIEQKQLWEAIGRLPETDAAILIYQYFYGYTTAEIGKLLSMRAGAVQKRSIRARKKLKERLSEEPSQRKEDANCNPSAKMN